jgi:hypothetical protein
MAALRAATEGVRRLALFSSNETVDDVATGDLKYLLVPFYLAEARMCACASLLPSCCCAATGPARALTRASRPCCVQLLAQSRAEERGPLVAGARRSKRCSAGGACQPLTRAAPARLCRGAARAGLLPGAVRRVWPAPGALLTRSRRRLFCAPCAAHVLMRLLLGRPSCAPRASAPSRRTPPRCAPRRWRASSGTKRCETHRCACLSAALRLG